MEGINLNKRKTHPRIMESIHNLLYSNFSFYAFFASKLNFIEREDIPTCAVNVTQNGMNFYYNRKFIEEDLTQKEFNFIVIHEIFHLLFRHNKRGIRNSYEHTKANAVQDMIINSTIVSDILRSSNPLTFKGEALIEMPKSKKDGRNIGLYLPKEYEESYVFEKLYDWVYANFETEEVVVNSLNDIEGFFESFNLEMEVEYGEFGKDLKESPIETYKLDKDRKNYTLVIGDHIEDEGVSDAQKNVMVESAIRSSLNSVRGEESRKAIEETLSKIRKPKKDYLKYIKRNLGQIIGGGDKVRTIVKPNRRQIKGLKGQRTTKTNIIVVLDTSGSMNGYFNKALSYVFQRNISITLIQVDTNVRETKNIKNHYELNRVVIKGLGGTVLMPAIQHIKDNNIKGNILVLTDGETDVLNFDGLKRRVLIISNRKKCPIEGDEGKVKQILIPD